jgi:hypothetical protein
MLGELVATGKDVGLTSRQPEVLSLLAAGARLPRPIKLPFETLSIQTVTQSDSHIRMMQVRR